ncbi:TPA: hypothetical protein HL326_29125, partial [Escherichia coli]|nr:hypothetical protein [Escherichia coli]HAI9883958.1 hypothetical protein [Escherichia coli]
MFAGKKLAQIREILISESTWEEMTCLFAPSLGGGKSTYACLKADNNSVSVNPFHWDMIFTATDLRYSAILATNSPELKT